MRESSLLNQKEVNNIWDTVWKEQQHTMSSRNIFRHRLFVEGYPVFKQYVPTHAKVILDVGSGTGRYGIQFAKDFPESQVMITDILDEALAVGGQLAREMGATNVSFQKEDAHHMSYASDTFDVVFCDVVIQHLPGYRDAVQEMIRVLKPGGTLILSAVNRWNIPHQLYKAGLTLRHKEYPYGYEKNFTPNELKRLLKKFPITVIAQDGFYFAYGIYRWKIYHPIWKKVGGAVNRVTKVLDAVTSRAVSRYLGFEVFVVGVKEGKK